MSHPDYKDIGDPTDHLIEECGELIQALCKAKRFGWNSRHPDFPDGPTSREKVTAEMSDVVEAYNSLNLRWIET